MHVFAHLTDYIYNVSMMSRRIAKRAAVSTINSSAW
jgi:hypothetical protein